MVAETIRTLGERMHAVIIVSVPPRWRSYPGAPARRTPCAQAPGPADRPGPRRVRAGFVMFWRYYQAGDRRGWLLPIAVAAELAWAAFLWRDYGNFLPWVRTAAVAAGAPSRVAVGWPAGRRGRNSPNGMASARAAMASGLAAAGREPPVLASPPPG